LELTWNEKGLIPVIVQDEKAGTVLMMAWANREAVQKTAETGTAWFFSRSRQALWNKGETSGNVIRVSAIMADCDRDTLLYRGTPTGPACHTGAASCFFRTIWRDENE